MRILPGTSCFSVLSVVTILFVLSGFANQAQAQRKAQRKKKDDRLATIQGVIKNDARKSFRVSYDEIKTSLRKVVNPTPPPVPSSFKEMKPDAQRKWLGDFYQSDRGKKYLKKQEKELNDAVSFEVKYNDEGDFTVYDVPVGEYGLQGRIDKEIDGIKYGFEVFARIKVLDDVDQIKLQPIPVTITPLFEQGQPAPPLNVKTAKGKNLTFDLEAYKDHYIFLNFMNTTDLTPGYQRQIQNMYKAIGESHKVKLVTIVMDKDKKKAITWLLTKKFTQGSYGFTEGWGNNKTIDAYGVRSTPSGWLISPDADRKILMSQHEFFRLARVSNSVTAIIRDRIDGKDTPTLATPQEEGSETKKEDDKEE